MIFREWLFLLAAVSFVVCCEKTMAQWRSSAYLIAENSDDEFVEDLDAELEMSQEEFRTKLNTGISLGIGFIIPWQTFGIGWLEKHHHHFLTWAVGGGNIRLNTHKEQQTYENKIFSQSLYAGMRYIPIDWLPFYLEPQIGLAHWRGKLIPKSNEALENSSYTGYGLVANIAVGIQWILNEDFFIEYGLLSLSKAKSFNISMSNVQSSKRRSIARESLEMPQTWGIINFKLGWIIN